MYTAQRYVVECIVLCCCIALHCVVLCCVVLCCVVLCCVVLCCIVLCCVLCCVALYCVLLHYMHIPYSPNRSESNRTNGLVEALVLAFAQLVSQCLKLVTDLMHRFEVCLGDLGSCQIVTTFNGNKKADIDCLMWEEAAIEWLHG
jgi:hypothetical protein